MNAIFNKFQFVVRELIQLTGLRPPPQLNAVSRLLNSVRAEDQAEIFRSINSSFLILLSGDQQAGYGEAETLLVRTASVPGWEQVGNFYLNLEHNVREEIEGVSSQNQEFAQRLESLSNWLSKDLSKVDQNQIIERFWSVFHPEAAGIWSHESTRIADLRKKRKITITNPSPEPIEDPAQQILFTANVLLTTPAQSTPLNELPINSELRQQLGEISQEEQVYWYDHPIQVGTAPEANEILHGLRGLQQALDYERAHSNASEDQQLTCLLSISVTHHGLERIARRYLAQVVESDGQLPGINIFAFTESDAHQLIAQVLAPAAQHYFGQEQADEILQVFGVEGEYGRHYTFLKAVAALWSVLIDPQIKATFKIDLDQVFPQEALKQQTGFSAFEHFRRSLWGAQGEDANGEPVELGMIAGALVDEDDIAQGLFTPDVPFPIPGRRFNPDEWVFFSQLPQGLSTEAEMMARYETAELDGRETCLQRVHVTGGTNGILVGSLRRHRPFTPSFIGRAEDQAYLLSTFAEPGTKLAYLHQPGLIMRHDKGAFAQKAIQAAQVGKLIGDYLRILYFSAYARAVGDNIEEIKARMDPFTGSFISYIPITLTLLRFALKVEGFFQAAETKQALEFQQLGVQRLSQALEITTGSAEKLRKQFIDERQGWELYYDTLLALEKGIQSGDPTAADLRRKARKLISALAIQTGKSNLQIN